MDPAEQAARRAYNEQVEAIHQAGAEEAVLRGTYIRGKDCDSLDAFGADPKERKVTACECCGQVGAKKKCGQCRCVYYCSRECQKQHWKMHKHVCAKMASAVHKADADRADPATRFCQSKTPGGPTRLTYSPEGVTDFHDLVEQTLDKFFEMFTPMPDFRREFQASYPMQATLAALGSALIRVPTEIADEALRRRKPKKNTAKKLRFAYDLGCFFMNCKRYHFRLQDIPEEERVRQLDAVFPDTCTKRMLRLEHDKFPVPTSLAECLPYSIPGCVKAINSRKSSSNVKRHMQEMMQIIQKEFAPGAYPPTWVVVEHVDGTMSDLHGWSFSWRMALKMGDQQYSGGLLIHT